MKLLALLVLLVLAACSSQPSQPSKPTSQALSSRLARLNPFATSSLPTVLVHSSATHTTGNSTTTPPIDTTGSDFLLVSTSGGYSTIQQTVTDSKNNTWLPLTTHGPNGVGGANIQLFYSFTPIVGSSHTFTTTSPVNSYQSIAVTAFSGMTGGTFDIQNGATHPNAAGTYPTGSITIPSTRQNELIISAIANGSTTADTINSGLMVLESQKYVNNANYGISLAYMVQASAAPINPAWTIGPQASMGGETVAAFSSVTTPPPPPLATQTITSGSSALPTTSISAGSCDITMLNVSAPGALPGDSINITPTSNAATAGYGPKGFNISWWINTNSISFVRCNSAATAQAPGPLTVNWRILR